jgi:hypothetical protein
VTGVYLKAEGNEVPQVTLQHAFLKNMLQTGILSHGGHVRLENSIITNCAEQALAGLGGGRYEIIFSTLANYAYDFIRFGPSFVFLERHEVDKKLIREASLQVEILNSILWGRQPEEVEFSNPMANGSSRTIRHSFLKTQAYRAEFANDGNRINVDPLFRDAPKFDFQIIKLSPANAAGIPVNGLTRDYEGKERDALKPDAGAFEVDY